MLNKLPPRTKLSKRSLLVIGVGGRPSHQYYTEPVTIIDEDGEQYENITFVYVPDCPENLMGRDLIQRLSLTLTVDGHKMVVNKRGEEVKTMMVLKGEGSPKKFYSMDPTSKGPTAVVNDLNHLPEELLTSMDWQPQTQFDLHAMIRYNPWKKDQQFFSKWQRITPTKGHIQSVYWCQRKNWMFATVLLPDNIVNLRLDDPPCIPLHISLAKNKTMKWQDFRQIVRDIMWAERGDNKEWDYTQEGHFRRMTSQGDTICRKDLNWNTMFCPTTHLDK